jgi:hypothetical protein
MQRLKPVDGALIGVKPQPATLPILCGRASGAGHMAAALWRPLRRLGSAASRVEVVQPLLVNLICIILRRQLALLIFLAVVIPNADGAGAAAPADQLLLLRSPPQVRRRGAVARGAGNRGVRPQRGAVVAVVLDHPHPRNVYGTRVVAAGGAAAIDVAAIILPLDWC